MENAHLPPSPETLQQIDLVTSISTIRGKRHTIPDKQLHSSIYRLQLLPHTDTVEKDPAQVAKMDRHKGRIHDLCQKIAARLMVLAS